MTINTLIKRLVGLVPLFFVVLTITLACQNSSVLNLNKTTASTPMVSHSDYLALSIDMMSIFPIRLKLEKYLNKLLLFDNQAFITVISSEEFSVLKSYVAMYEIEEISAKYFQYLQKNPGQIEAICVGALHINSLSTNFIFLKSQSLVQLKREVQKRLVV